MKKIFILLLAVIVSFIPTAFAFAASDYVLPTQNGDIGSVIFWVIKIINLLIYLIVAFAVLAFMYGISQTILHGDDSEARKKGRDIMIYGVIGLAVMLGFWSIVGFVGRSFGLGSNGVIPQFDPTTGTVTHGGNGVTGSLSSPAS